MAKSKHEFGGGTPTYSVNEYTMTNNTVRTFACTNAWFMIGTQQTYSQYYYGYVENGVLTVLYNYSSGLTAAYSNGELSLKLNVSLSDTNRYLKIMYM